MSHREPGARGCGLTELHAPTFGRTGVKVTQLGYDPMELPGSSSTWGREVDPGLASFVAW